LVLLKEAEMDTKTLMGGQDVYVVSSHGLLFRQGKVTEITPDGVEVLTAPFSYPADKLSQFEHDVNQLSWVEPVGCNVNLRYWAIPIRFDNEGNNGSDGEDGWDVWGFGPWRIDDIPFEERRGGMFEGGV